MTEHAGSVGTVAEEAAKLFEALSDWARGHTGVLHDLPLATGSAECRLCPVCQLLGTLRAARPETFDHLLDATGSLVAALRSAVDAHERSWAARRTPGVEKIDVE